MFAFCSERGTITAKAGVSSRLPAVSVLVPRSCRSCAALGESSALLRGRDCDASALLPNPMAICPLGSAENRHGQTPNGSGGAEAPKPLHRSRLPAPRPVGDEPGRSPTEGRPDLRAEVEVGKLVARLQDGGVKPAGKAANGVVASPALKTSTLQARRPAPRPGIYGREGERAPGAVARAGVPPKRGRRSATLPRKALCAEPALPAAHRAPGRPERVVGFLP